MKSFNEVYEEIYKQNHEELEKLRKDRAKRTAILTALALISIGTLTAMALKVISSNITVKLDTGVLFPWSIVITIMLIVIISATNKRKYTEIFKHKVIEPFVKNIDENLNYNSNRGIPSTLYRQGEFERFDRYSSEDLIEGILDGKYQVKMGEVHTQDESRDSEGRTHTHTLFYGIFGNVECAKNINTNLKIRSDKGILGNIFKGKTRIQMDSSEFEKYFDINAGNKIIAMQILTSDVMQMMIEFREQSKIKYELTMRDNQIYIRFHTGEVFEPKMFTHSLDYDMLKKYYDIIDFIFKVSREINKVIENTEI